MQITIDIDNGYKEIAERIANEKNFDLDYVLNVAIKNFIDDYIELRQDLDETYIYLNVKRDLKNSLFEISKYLDMTGNKFIVSVLEDFVNKFDNEMQKVK